MAASGEHLDVDESGPQCSEASALAELSDVEIVINGFEELMALSDAELSALSQPNEVSAFSLDSFLAPVEAGKDPRRLPGARFPSRRVMD